MEVERRSTAPVVQQDVAETGRGQPSHGMHQGARELRLVVVGGDDLRHLEAPGGQGLPAVAGETRPISMCNCPCHGSSDFGTDRKDASKELVTRPGFYVSW